MAPSQDDIDLSRGGIDLHVVWPVHRRGADEIGCPARFDHQISLAREATPDPDRTLAVDEREPGEGPVRVEACDREDAVIEEVGVGAAIVWVEPACREDAIDVLPMLIVPGVDCHAAVRG
jgi:hypothetical protein